MHATADFVRGAMTSGPSSRRRLLAVLGLSFVCALAGCYGEGPSGAQRGDANSGAGAPTEIYPAGILTTRDAKTSIQGVYPAASDGAQSCCWLGPEARFRVDADADVRNIKLTVYEPVMGQLAKSQRVSLLDSAGHVFSSHAVAAGSQTFSLPVPRNIVGNRSVSVRLRMAASVVPKDIGVNGDPRRLSIILQDISAQ